MKAKLKKLKQFREEQSLVSISRSGCDNRKIQAFVLHVSDTLVLLQYIFDFRTDGLLLVRNADITKLERTATDEFQKQLLIKEGIFDSIDFSYRPPIDSYDVFLRTLPKKEIVILEDELADDPEFLIGTLIAVDKEQASIRFFTGAASWADDPSIIRIDSITACQTDTNYTNFYARHFSRVGT